MLNAVVLFISGFSWTAETNQILAVLDHAFTLLFTLELGLKTYALGFRKYWLSNWNKLDLTLVALSLPSLLTFVLDLDAQDLSFLLVFRITRIFKSFRFLKFIPGIVDLLKGIQRALKASVIVLIGFGVYIFINSMLSFYMFRSFQSTFFKDPLISLYSIFKIFTIEGWYEIPETLVKQMNATQAFLTHVYFIFILLSGGIFGLSLVNSIFVDAMVSDNTDDLEKKIDALDEKLERLINNRD